MSTLPIDLAEAIVSFKQAQKAILEFYRTKPQAYQRSPEGKRELIRLKTRLDSRLENLGSYIVTDLGEEAERTLHNREKAPKHYTEFEF